jgi:hypothetical protein
MFPDPAEPRHSLNSKALEWSHPLWIHLHLH